MSLEVVGTSVGLIAVTLVLSRFRRARRLRAVLEECERLPAVAHDFSTPEGAILCLEDAYRAHRIEDAVAAKDFVAEARLMLAGQVGKSPGDEVVELTAIALEGSFRAHLKGAWPNFARAQSFFPRKRPYARDVVAVVEVCRFPTGEVTTQEILVAKTEKGWRVLNPLPQRRAGA